VTAEPPVTPDVGARLAALATEYELPQGAAAQLLCLLELVAGSQHALTSVRDPEAGVDVHVADSLTGLCEPAVREARRMADLGSGGGFPGLVLAIARPDTHVTLVESVGKKAAFLVAAAAGLGLGNTTVVAARAESWPSGVGTCDLVTARALAPLGVLLEYAAPLLAQEGALVAWKGRRDADEERVARSAASQLGMSAPSSRKVSADGTPERHLYLSRKVASTPPRFPRRQGMARKRPLGA
jgi:16S rRNA (guanine527-N7)-methyltransferase